METDEDYDALRCIVNYARSQTRCSLGQARQHALASGFSEASVENAIKFWRRNLDSLRR